MIVYDIRRTEYTAEILYNISVFRENELVNNDITFTLIKCLP